MVETNKQEAYPIPPAENSYRALNKYALEKSVARTEASLRLFEETHLTLRLRRAELEADILAAEAPEVKNRALDARQLEQPTPLPQAKSIFTTIVANINAGKKSHPASSPLSYSPNHDASLLKKNNTFDPRDRAPSLSYSESTAPSSHPPRTPHASPPVTPHRHGKTHSNK